jgi:hypothetical protein
MRAKGVGALLDKKLSSFILFYAAFFMAPLKLVYQMILYMINTFASTIEQFKTY